MHWSGMSPNEAREALVKKDKSKRDKRMGLAEAVSTFVKDGHNIGIGGFVNSRQPVAIVHEMIRQGKKDLSLAFHSAGLAPEYMGAAMVLGDSGFSFKSIESSYWAHESFGLSPMFRYLAEGGKIGLEDWSNFNMSARFKAASMGLPFIPTRSPLGSDVLQINRTVVMDCPFTGSPLALVPACHPNVAIIHVQKADIYGNCLIEGPLFTDPELAMAAGNVIVTCEKLVAHEDMTLDPNRINIPFFAVDAVVEVPFGAYPGNCHSHYYFDEKHIKGFVAASEAFRKGNPQPLKEYFENYVTGVQNTGEFMDKIPFSHLSYIQKIELRDMFLLREPVAKPNGD